MKRKFNLPKHRKGNCVVDIHAGKSWIIERCSPYHGTYIYAVRAADGRIGDTGTTFAEHEIKIQNGNQLSKRDSPVGNNGDYDDLPF